jgi:hypothetical protein
VATDLHTTREELLETVLSIGSTLKLHSEHELDNIFIFFCYNSDTVAPIVHQIMTELSKAVSEGDE